MADLTPIATPPAQAAPAPPAPAAPAPAAPAPMYNNYPPQQQQMKVADVFKRINWIEVLFGSLGVATLCYSILYYKNGIAMSKTFQNEIRNKIDDLTIKVSDVSSALERENTSQQTPTQGFF